jgi:hypothetical protein
MISKTDLLTCCLSLSETRLPNAFFHNVIKNLKLKLSNYRPGQALRAPGV